VSARSDLFSSSGAPARQKFLFLGSSPFSSENHADRLRSLNIEHVSSADLIRQEISRRTPAGLAAERAIREGSPLMDETALALLRRWFWARKPDAGFALSGFPATLLQAKVLDEWLDARDENLDGVVVGETISPDPVAGHYRTLGLVIGADELAAA